MEQHLILVCKKVPHETELRYTGIVFERSLAMDTPNKEYSGRVQRQRVKELVSDDPITLGEGSSPPPAELLEDIAENRVHVRFDQPLTCALPAFFAPVLARVMMTNVIVAPFVQCLDELPDVRASLAQIEATIVRVNTGMLSKFNIAVEGVPIDLSHIKKLNKLAKHTPLAPPLYLPIETTTAQANVLGVWQLIARRPDGAVDGRLYLWGTGELPPAGAILSRTVKWQEGSETRSLTKEIGRIISYP